MPQALIVQSAARTAARFVFGDITLPSVQQWNA
jgi:hypothetical protein